MIPSYEDFLNEFLSCGYPIGDKKQTYNRMLWHIQNKQDLDGNVLTIEYLFRKFKEHIDLWNKMYAKKEQDGYLSKEAEKKRKSLYEFLGDEFYNQEFVISKGTSERDNYLFGNMNIGYLIQKLKEFESKLKHK